MRFGVWFNFSPVARTFVIQYFSLLVTAFERGEKYGWHTWKVLGLLLAKKKIQAQDASSGSETTVWVNYAHNAKYSSLSHKECVLSRTIMPHPCWAMSALGIMAYIFCHLVANSDLQPRGYLVGREDHLANSQTAFGQTELHIPLKVDLPLLWRPS